MYNEVFVSPFHDVRVTCVRSLRWRIWETMCSTGFHQSEDVDTLVHPVMTKVECNKEGTNVRHVVTSMYMKSPKEIYERFYCKSGDCELYIKELKNGLGADRMSCANFAANQFRLFMHAAAYALLLETKQILFRDCRLSYATISTFREKVILTAIRIKEFKTKIKVEFVRDHPIRAMMRMTLRKAS